METKHIIQLANTFHDYCPCSLIPFNDALPPPRQGSLEQVYMCVLDVRDEATISFVPNDYRDERRGGEYTVGSTRSL